MDFDSKVIEKLILRGFTKEQLLNNRGLIGAAIDEIALIVVKNINNDALLARGSDVERRELFNNFYAWLDGLAQEEYDDMSLTDKCEKFFFKLLNDG